MHRAASAMGTAVDHSGVAGSVMIMIGGRRRQSHFRGRRPSRARACARCDRPFLPTLVRRLTCHSCYLANTDLDPAASRGEPSGPMGRSTTGAHDG
jgi:hypothetical protein